MLSTILFFILGLVMICIAGDRLVDAAAAIANKLQIPQIVVGATIVSLGTTLPEILVSTTAAFGGSSAIAAGNAFGSIICNTALIAGLTQTIRPARQDDSFSVAWRSCFFFLIIGAMAVYSRMKGIYDRPMGILLLTAFVIYACLSVRFSLGENSQNETENAEDVSITVQLFILATCAALLYIGANLLVDNGILIARAIQIPERVIAVTFIALGTSLPELITSLMSLFKGYGNVGLGNVIGANILNLLLVIGIPAVVEGIPLEAQTVTVDLPLAVMVMAILLIPILMRKKSSRVQGGVLLSIYILYCIQAFL